MSTDAATLWIAGELERFFAVPAGTPLAEGEVALLSLDGAERTAALADLEPWVVDEETAHQLFADHQKGVVEGWMATARELMLGPEAAQADDAGPEIDLDDVDVDAVIARLGRVAREQPEVLREGLVRLDAQSAAIERLTELAPADTPGGRPDQHLRAIVDGLKGVLADLEASEAASRRPTMSSWLPFFEAVAAFADEEAAAEDTGPPVEERVRADLAASEAEREPVSFDFQSLISGPADT